MSDAPASGGGVMTVDQTILASDPKRLGNCLSACVATFLDLPLDEVPHFVELGSDLAGDETDPHAWWWTLLKVNEVLAFRPGRHDHAPTTSTEGYDQPLCPACGLLAASPGEGRYCGSCEDHEGHCPADHCMTCGADT